MQFLRLQLRQRVRPLIVVSEYPLHLRDAYFRPTGEADKPLKGVGKSGFAESEEERAAPHDRSANRPEKPSSFAE
jgi:hypothetical protein